MLSSSDTNPQTHPVNVKSKCFAISDYVAAHSELPADLATTLRLGIRKHFADKKALSDDSRATAVLIKDE